MNAGSDWPSSRALLTLKPWRRRWTLNSTWTIQQTARNCAGQFSILSPGEKCESAYPDCYTIMRWQLGRNGDGVLKSGHVHKVRARTLCKRDALYALANPPSLLTEGPVGHAVKRDGSCEILLFCWRARSFRDC